MTDREKLIDLIVSADISLFGTGKPYAEVYADHLLVNGVIVPPCREGDTIYKIVKFCEENTGYKEFYRPTKEFEEDCPYLERASWYDDADECKAIEDYHERQYCTLNLKIFCDKCKERFAIQKDKFAYSMMHQVYNSPMFDSNTTLEYTYFRTKEEAEKALKEKINESI